jgi:hypothetical protein
VFREKCIRNEKVQADYIGDLLQIYDQEKITGAFVFDFYSQHLTYNQDPEADFDKASYSITKSVGNNKWERKHFLKYQNFTETLKVADKSYKS